MTTKTKLCDRCKAELPLEAAFCDQCGGSQFSVPAAPPKQPWLVRFWVIPVAALALVAVISVLITVYVLMKPEDPMAFLGEYKYVDEMVDEYGGAIYNDFYLGPEYSMKAKVHGKEGNLEVHFDEKEKIEGYTFKYEFSDDDKDEGIEYCRELIEIYTALYGEPIREMFALPKYTGHWQERYYFTNKDGDLMVAVRRYYELTSKTNEVWIEWYAAYGGKEIEKPE